MMTGTAFAGHGHGRARLSGVQNLGVSGANALGYTRIQAVPRGAAVSDRAQRGVAAGGQGASASLFWGAEDDV